MCGCGESRAAFRESSKSLPGLFHSPYPAMWRTARPDYSVSPDLRIKGQRLFGSRLQPSSTLPAHSRHCREKSGTGGLRDGTRPAFLKLSARKPFCHAAAHCQRRRTTERRCTINSAAKSAFMRVTFASWRARKRRIALAALEKLHPLGNTEVVPVPLVSFLGAAAGYFFK